MYSVVLRSRAETSELSLSRQLTLRGSQCPPKNLVRHFGPKQVIADARPSKGKDKRKLGRECREFDEKQRGVHGGRAVTPADEPAGDKRGRECLIGPVDIACASERCNRPWVWVAEGGMSLGRTRGQVAVLPQPRMRCIGCYV